MAFDCGITHFKKQIGGKPRVWIEYCGSFDKLFELRVSFSSPYVSL